MEEVPREMLDILAKELTDQGRLIEAGWIGLRLMIPRDAPARQFEDMRNAFFAGAQHLFGSIMGILGPGEEASEKDMRRLTLIDNELKEFLKEFKKKHFSIN